MADFITVEMGMEDCPATGSYEGLKYHGYLPAGYLWELVGADYFIDTGKAASATNCNLIKLYDPSGNVMATASGAGALIQYNAMTLSSTYTTVDASTAAARPYVGLDWSGSGEAVGEGMRVISVWRARRPATAAGGLV
jgi:hypothetical protein